MTDDVFGGRTHSPVLEHTNGVACPRNPSRQLTTHVSPSSPPPGQSKSRDPITSVALISAVVPGVVVVARVDEKEGLDDVVTPLTETVVVAAVVVVLSVKRLNR